MSNINHVILSGNLTREPDIKYSPAGACILEFGIAVNDSRKNQNGQWENYANFFDCTVFGKRAEALSEILAKGMKVTVSGRLHYSAWEKDGQKRSKVSVNVDAVELPQRQQQTQRQGYTQEQQHMSQPEWGEGNPPF